MNTCFFYTYSQNAEFQWAQKEVTQYENGEIGALVLIKCKIYEKHALQKEKTVEAVKEL